MALKPDYYDLEIKYNGRVPRTFETPIPFKSKSEKTGEVTCNPTGVFKYADGKALLSIDPTMFELVRELSPTGAPDEVKEEVKEETVIEEQPSHKKAKGWPKGKKRKKKKHAVTEQSEGQLEPSLETAG